MRREGAGFIDRRPDKGNQQEIGKLFSRDECRSFVFLLSPPTRDHFPLRDSSIRRNVFHFDWDSAERSLQQQIRL